MISIYFVVISLSLEVRMCLGLGRAKQLMYGYLSCKSNLAICQSSVFKTYHAV